MSYTDVVEVRMQSQLLVSVSILLTFTTFPIINGADVLVVSIFGSISHNLALHPIGVGLADKGHQVTYLSSHHFADKDSKITYFTPESLHTTIKFLLSQLGNPEDRAAKATSIFTAFYPFILKLCNVFYDDPIIQEWIHKSHFDLIIIDGIYNECLYGLVHKYKAQFIIFHSTPFLPWHADVLGLPHESSWLPDMRFNYTHPLGFFERVYNTYATIEMHLYHMSFNYYPVLTEVIRKGLKDSSVPEVSEMYQNVSIVFVNSYFSSEYARSLPPFVIPIGGIHCSIPKKNLSTEIEEFIDKKAIDGFVYISFGTAFKPSQASLHDIFQAMKRFNRIAFIFRWYGTFPEERADNVLFVSWAAQQTLLAHPKMRVFVSHCGMSGTQEAIYYGIPVLAIAGFADQDYNAESLARVGAARRLELTDFNEGAFEEALHDLLTNPAYKERLRMLRSLYHDRPQTPLETAVWWSEYVIRHSKAGSDLSLMKPLGINQYWWQRRLVDIYFLIFLTLVVVVGVLVTLVFLILRIVRFYNTSRIVGEKKVK